MYLLIFSLIIFDIQIFRCCNCFSSKEFL